MATEHSCLDHEKYLAKVPADVVYQRLQVFRLDPTAMAVPPLICLSAIVEEPFTDYRQWLHPLVPRTLDDLKNWFGVPNEIAKQVENQSSSAGARCCCATDSAQKILPMMHRYDYHALDHVQQGAIRQTANDLLYGYVAPEAAARPPLSGVISYMLDTANRARPSIFVAPDLIVCPDNVVQFKNVPAMYFNNILIYGNGRIVTKSKTKIHAYQISHVDV